MLSSNKKITNLGLQFRKTDLIKKKKKKEKQCPTGSDGSRDEQQTLNTFKKDIF